MATILKGQVAEIKISVSAKFTETDTDDFTVVVKRGNDSEYDELLKEVRGDNPPSDRELCDRYITRLEDLTDQNGQPVNGDGCMSWLPRDTQKTGTALTDDQEVALEIADVMMGMLAYRSALINAVYAGVGNAAMYQAGRLGNLMN